MNIKKSYSPQDRSRKEADNSGVWELIKTWTPSVAVFGFSLYWIINRGTYTWIDNADLVIHEAGHLFFFIFGKFIYTAGGTLMQIILPSIIVFYFLKSLYRTGMQFGLLWLGQNFINISVYAADAQEKKLKLLGGSKVYHDWNYMLGEINMLEYSAEVGYFFFGVAILIFITAVLLPLLIRD
jgi:hypothetical protein